MYRLISSSHVLTAFLVFVAFAISFLMSPIFLYLQVLFKNLNVDMKEVKPSKLLEGLEREVEGNPDFSNKDPVFSQSPSPALSANNSSQSVTVPSLPQQLDIPPELPIPTQPATSLASSVISQVCSLNALVL